jgi:hypothetical protein
MKPVSSRRLRNAFARMARTAQFAAPTALCTGVAYCTRQAVLARPSAWFRSARGSNVSTQCSLCALAASWRRHYMRTVLVLTSATPDAARSAGGLEAKSRRESEAEDGKGYAPAMYPHLTFVMTPEGPDGRAH